MRQRKLKQRKSKQSKSLAKILTLGIATATFVSSMSVPGGLLAPIPEALEKSGVKGMGWSKTMKNRVSECP